MPPAHPDPDPDLQACLDGERALLSGAVRADAAAVAALLADDFTEFGASGRAYDKQGILDHITADGRDVDHEDMTAHRLCTDVVLVTFRTVRGGTAAHRSSIWVRQADGQWRMRHHQGTATATFA